MECEEEDRVRYKYRREELRPATRGYQTAAITPGGAAEPNTSPTPCKVIAPNSQPCRKHPSQSSKRCVPPSGSVCLGAHPTHNRCSSWTRGSSSTSRAAARSAAPCAATIFSSTSSSTTRSRRPPPHKSTPSAPSCVPPRPFFPARVPPPADAAPCRRGASISLGHPRQQRHIDGDARGHPIVLTSGGPCSSTRTSCTRLWRGGRACIFFCR